MAKIPPVPGWDRQWSGGVIAGMGKPPSPEAAWLHLYRCHADVLCDPMKSVELTDKVFIAFMERFTDKEKAPLKRGDSSSS